MYHTLNTWHLPGIDKRNLELYRLRNTSGTSVHTCIYYDGVMCQYLQQSRICHVILINIRCEYVIRMTQRLWFPFVDTTNFHSFYIINASVRHFSALQTELQSTSMVSQQKTTLQHINRCFQNVTSQ